MKIDDFIKNIGNSRKNGSNKDCYLFDEYVLLYGSCKEDEIKRVMKITSELDQQGVAALPTLAYKIVVPPNELGYMRGYTLQRRAKGSELYYYRMPEAEYQKRLAEVAKMVPKGMDKFVSDWLAIREAGLIIDPSKAENFFYSEGGISFIDLNLSDRGGVELKTEFHRASAVLTGLRLKYQYTPNEKNFNQVLKGLTQAFFDQGLTAPEAEEILSGYVKDKEQLKTIIISAQKRRTNQDHPSKKSQPVPTSLHMLKNARSGRP